MIETRVVWIASRAWNMSLAATSERPPLLAPEGERKVATVLFADVVNSSRLVTGMDPEDADERLLAALQVMTDAVRAHGGAVNQVLGDGIMAAFGVPQAQEDHALRACMAADAMHGALRDLAIQGERPIELRIGLASGGVLAKPPLADFDLAYRLVGECVYLARRLQESAPARTTLLAPATGDLADSGVSVTAGGDILLKDGMRTVRSLRLTGIERRRRRYRGTAANARSRFVGRTDHLQRIVDAISGFDEGRGKIVVVTGDAGVGKSRLVAEFLSDLSKGTCRAVRCDLLPHGLARPMEPSSQLLHTLLAEAGTGLDLTSGAGDLAAALRALGLDDPVALAALLDTAGIRVDDPAWNRMEADERLHAVADGLCQLICALGEGRGLTVVVEDHQWVDSKTRAVLDAVAQCTDRAPVLLLVTCRSGHRPLWSEWPVVEEVSLDPLSRRETSVLLDSLLGSRRELVELKHDLAARAQGNPFFLEECVRALEEAGAFAGQPGDYRLAVPGAKVELPATVQAALAERIDGLDPRDRAVLLDASVIGLCVDVALLSDLTGHDRADLQRTLDRLQAGGFLERIRVIPNLEYSFRHVLIHEVAYDTLLKRRRPLLHSRVAAAVRTRSPTQLPGKAELLAYHAFRAEDWPMAYACGRRAGQRALARSANREAADHFAAALEAFRRLDRDFRKPRREFDIRLDLAQACFPLSRQDEVRAHLERARSLAEAGQDERRRIKALSLTGLYFWYSGKMALAAEAGTLALDRAVAIGEAELETSIRVRLGAIYLDLGNYGAASDLLISAAGDVSSGRTANPAGLLADLSSGIFATWSRGLAETGRFGEAIAAVDEAVQLAEDSGHAFSRIYAALVAGYTLLRKGDFERSLPILERCLELCQAKRFKSVDSLAAVAMGYAAVQSGDVERGLDLLSGGAASPESQSLVIRPSVQACWIGEACLLTGRLEEARSHASEALALALKHGECGHEAWALWLLGCIALERPAATEAESCFLRAAELAAARDMTPLSAHCHVGLARYLLARGERDAALAEWRSASATYRELGMTGWLARARQDLRGLVEQPEVVPEVVIAR